MKKIDTRKIATEIIGILAHHQAPIWTIDLIFEAVREELPNQIIESRAADYIKIPLSAITDCRGLNVGESLKDSSLADKLDYIKRNEEMIEQLGCTITFQQC
jgi:hypothetical protein